MIGAAVTSTPLWVPVVTVGGGVASAALVAWFALRGARTTAAVNSRSVVLDEMKFFVDLKDRAIDELKARVLHLELENEELRKKVAALERRGH